MDPAALYELAFNSLPMGTYLLSPTPEAVILAVNDAFLQASSRKREELVGQSLFAAFPENPDDKEDTGVAALRSSILRVIATGKPDQLPLQRYPIWITTPEGEKRYEERFWSALNVPVFDRGGQLVCILHRTTDVTGQARAEAAVRKSEARYRNLFESIDQGFCVIEMLYDGDDRVSDYRFLEVNPAFELQTGLGNAVGKTMRELRPGHEQHWFDIYDRVARTGEPIRFENEARQLDRWYDVYAFRVEEPGARKVAILFKDITDRMKAEEALRQADRRKDEFLAMLAHELRNPLAPIAAAADLLALGRLNEPHVKQTSAIIARQVLHMTGLIDDLLDVSRVTRGLISLDKTRLDAKRIVAEAVEQVRPLIEARGHSLTIHTPPDSAFVLGDQKRLVQVRCNLLNNAAKYTPEGGEIVLNVEVEGDVVKMVVADNGIGMTSELLERAFELFAQAERASDRAQGGLGIGLALVKSLMELHGGSVTAESAGAGKGSKFIVRVPHLADSHDASDTQPGFPPDYGQAKALKIMVVDDNADAAQMMSILVEALGHHVLTEHGFLECPGARNARKAGRLPARHRPAGDGWQRTGEMPARRPGNRRFDPDCRHRLRTGERPQEFDGGRIRLSPRQAGQYGATGGHTCEGRQGMSG